MSRRGRLCGARRRRRGGARAPRGRRSRRWRAAPPGRSSGPEGAAPRRSGLRPAGGAARRRELAAAGPRRARRRTEQDERARHGGHAAGCGAGHAASAGPRGASERPAPRARRGAGLAVSRRAPEAPGRPDRAAAATGLGGAARERGARLERAKGDGERRDRGAAAASRARQRRAAATRLSRASRRSFHTVVRGIASSSAISWTASSSRSCATRIARRRGGHLQEQIREDARVCCASMSRVSESALRWRARPAPPPATALRAGDGRDCARWRSGLRRDPQEPGAHAGDAGSYRGSDREAPRKISWTRSSRSAPRKPCRST